MEIQDELSIINNERVWKMIGILGAEYIISTTASEDYWKISLSNLIQIWTETITKDIALARCQSLNPLLDLDSFNIKETLDTMLNDIPKNVTERSLEEIKLETCIDGITFNFSINLTQGSTEQFWNEITKPLCQSSFELQRRQRIMIDLIKKKDEEILEYKLSGAELTRKNIETLPYNNNIFGDEVASDNLQAGNYMATFKSMMDIRNELKKHKSLMNNDQKSLLQESSRDPNPGKPKREPDEMPVAHINNGSELESKIKLETTTDHSIDPGNQSTTSETRTIDEYEVRKPKTSVSESRISSRTRKGTKKQSTVDDVAIMPVRSSDNEANKKSKKVKTTPNIYDFIA